MNNVWPVALRLPSSCSSLHPLTSTRSWPSSLLRTARRGFAVLPRARSSPIPCAKWPLCRLPISQSCTNGILRPFSSTHALARSKKKTPPPPPPPPPAKQEPELETDPSLEDDTYYPSSLPSGPLPQDTVERLFPTLHPIDGNRILSILHTRRLTGSLSERGISGVDDAMNVDLSDISPEQFMKALEYLRASFPVDEEAAAVDWAEAEAGRIEREILSERGVKLGLLKKVEPNPETEEQEKRGEEWEGQRFITVKAREAREAQLGAVGGQGTEYGREKYGRSVFETLRKSNEANWEAEKAEKERIKLEEEAKMVAEGRDKGPQDLVPKKRFLGVEIRESGEKSEYVKKYEEKAQLKFKSEEEMARSLTRFQRLWPSTLFSVAVCILCGLFATGYEPPDNAVRLFKDITPALATCSVLLGLNVFFVLAWRIPRFWPFMNKYMVSAPGYPIAFATLGNVFSHQQFSHLLVNMTWLMTFGVWCHELVGRGFFLSTYIAAGTCGSLASLAYFVLTRNFKSASIGASGAVNGMFALLCVATSRDHVRVPFTEWDMALNPKLALVAYLALEVYNFRMRRFKTMDHMAHLAGAAVGIGAGTAWRWKDLVAWWEAWMGNGEEGSDGGGDVMKKVEGDQEELGAGRKEGEA